MAQKGFFSRLWGRKGQGEAPPPSEAPVEEKAAEPSVERAPVEPPIEVVTAELPLEIPTAEPPIEVVTAEPPLEIPTAEPPIEVVTAELPLEIPTAEPPLEIVTAKPSPPPISPPPESPPPEPPQSWFARMRQGLLKSSSRLTRGISDLFTKRKLDEEALEDLQDLLISADLGVATAARVTKRLAAARFGQDVEEMEIRAALAEEVIAILAPVARPLAPDFTRKPHVVLVVGVNGSGKTTTIGKMAKFYRDQGRQVTLVAGDTFRAAAVEQLKIWGDRAGCPVIARDTGADAAGLVFDALVETRARGDDLVFIDTAGRLQNKTHLMAELEKIVRVMRKQDETAPHDVLLVLDATVGQNAHSQVEIFREMIGVTGLILTKLDGTARGGVLVALAEKFQLPVHAIGVGEKTEDLRPFDAEVFARSLVGL